VTWESWFSLSSSLAMAGWASLILLPRWAWLRQGLSYGLVSLLAMAYVTLILGYFFQVEGGGFDSIAAVRTLFASDPVLLAGWLHYLAFDLFVGLWIAARADALSLSRLLQAPILAATFMFGPLGLLLFHAVLAVRLLDRRSFQGAWSKC
jgi:hypothetical protein